MAVDISKSKTMTNLNSIMKKGVEEASSVVTKNIPLELIDKNPDNEKIFRMTEIDQLADIIKENGFTGAIEVYQKPDGRYLISSGHRRYEAMKLLGEKTIPCYVSPMEDLYKVKLKLIDSNIHTRVLSPLDLARAIIYYENTLYESNFKGSVQNQTSKHFGISVSKIHRLKALTKLIDNIQDLATSPTFPYEAFYEAVSFGKENQEKLYEMLQEHIRLFPDADISLVVVQSINRIKADIENEKEKVRKEKILKEAKSLIKKSAVDDSIEKVDNPDYFANISNEAPTIITEKQDDTIEPLKQETINYQDEKFEEKDIQNDYINDSDEEKDISFELSSYFTKIKALLNESNIAIKDKHIVESVLGDIHYITEKINQL